MVSSMAVFWRVLFWVLTIVTCFAVIYCTYHIEKPIAVHTPVEEIAIWGALVALACAVGLFLVMPSTPNGRKGLLVAFGITGFAVWCSFQALQQTRFLYRRADLSVRIESAPDESGAVRTVTVGGQLYLPVSGYELPVALLMPDASEDSFVRNVFYAKALARRGVAALAYERSAVDPPTLLAPTDLETSGEDVIYMLDLLDKISAIYMRRAGLMGFYENEWAIPYITQKTNRVNYGVLLAPSGITPAERATALIGHEIRGAGHSPEDAETAASLLRDLAENLRTGDVGEARARLIERWNAVSGEPWFKAAGFPEEPPRVGSLSPFATAMSFNPKQLWGDIRMPIRIIAGSEDPTSLPETLRERFTQYVEGNKYFEDNARAAWDIEVIPGANHRMLTGADVFAAGADFPPGLFDNLADWIKRTTAPPEVGSPAGQGAPATP